MRLSKTQIPVIKHIAQKIFLPSSAVYLFGSRVDDTKKGGDIDLLIECEKSHNTFDNVLQFKCELKRAIGNQKIDVIIKNCNEQDDRLIVKQAFEHGVQL